MKFQAFLPIVTEMSRIHSLVAIPLTDFSSAPPSINLAGAVFPLVEKSMRSTRMPGNGAISYMGIPTTERDLRYGSFHVPGSVSISNLIPRGFDCVVRGAVISPSGILDWISNFFVMGAPILPAGSGVVVPPPTTNTMEWTISSILSSASGCTYFDIDWVATYEANSDKTPVSIVVSSPEDPAISSVLKVFQVQSPADVTVVNGPQTLLRFVKVQPAELPVGNAVFPASVLNTDGSSTPINIVIEVSP